MVVTEQFSLSIIVPCYNEALNLPLIFQRFKQLGDHMPRVQVVLVDNGSDDDTQAVLTQQIALMEEKYRHLFKCVRVDVNKGYGLGILQGLQAADAPILSWTHADMQTDPLDLLAAYECYMSSTDDRVVVKGKRKNRPVLDSLFTLGMQIFTYFALKVSINDINAQPKLFSRRFYNEALGYNAPHDFSLDLYMLYRANELNYKVLTVPVIFADRQFGEAKGGGSWKTKWKLIRRTMSYILQLKHSL